MAAGCLLTVGASPAVPEDEHVVYPISLITLIANPDQWDGKIVKVMAYARVGFDMIAPT